MRKFLILAFAAFFAGLTVAHGNMMLVPSPAGVAYTGPGDIKSGALVWYSAARAYSLADAEAGVNLFELTRASDNAFCDIKVKSDGNIDLVNTGCSTPVATWCASTTCTIFTFYNRGSGGANYDMVAGSGTGTYTPSCASTTKPCAALNLSASYAMEADQTQAIAQPCSIAGVQQITSVDAGFTYQAGIVTDGWATRNYALYVYGGTSPSQYDWYLNATEGITSGVVAQHLNAIAGYNVSGASASSLRVTSATENNTLTFTSAENCGSGTVNMTNNNNGRMTTNFFEYGVWTLGFSSADRDAEIANARAFYGF